MAFSLGTVATVALTASQATTEPIRPSQTVAQSDAMPPTRAAREERAIQEARRQQLAEKEAALAVKEEELKKLAARIDAQLKVMEATKKSYEEMVKAEEERRKQAHSERVNKMVLLFKTLKAPQAASLLDNMEETEAKLVLDRLDIKVVAKLVPNLNQPRTIRWVNENLRKRGEK
jgi:flagellar motility protein MotE (MotC chaperone)